MVDQEQLPLVVAEVLPEGEGLLDDLLRGADGQRGEVAELLQAGAVAVDRGLVEIGTELGLGLLGVLGDVGLAAEPDDRLLLRPVAVVLEALPVEVDQPDVVLLGPEDVVGEEAVAVVGGLLGDLRGADRAVPDERRDVIQRAGVEVKPPRRAVRNLPSQSTTSSRHSRCSRL